MYKALIFDLDNTVVRLTSDGSDVTEETREAVKLAESKGIKLTCATGRHWDLVKPVIQSLGLTHSLGIIEGGTRIINFQTEETVWEKGLSDEAALQVFDVYKKVAGKGILMTSANNSRKELETVSEIPQNIRLLYLLGISKEIGTALTKAINGNMEAIAHLTPSWHGTDLVDVHVTHPQGTKQYAIHKWQELEGVTKEETIGMGDSGNDLPIFQAAGFKIAVENATPDLKALADHISPSADKGALKYVLDKFFAM